MKKILLIFALFVLAQGAPVSYAQEAKQYYVISSGSPGGNYHKTGIIVSELLNEISEKAFFIAVSSTGSIDNISKLKERFADFTIVQEDVLLKNFHGDKDGIKNITLLFPLFQEKFIIYTHHDTPISFGKFRQSIKAKNLEKLRVGVTDKKGTTYETFSSIGGLLGVDLNNISFVVEDYSILIEKFKKREIDYFITLSLPIKELEKRKQTSVVYFDKKQIFLLKSKIPQLSEAHFENPNHKTLGVWSFLIGLDSSIKRVGEREIIDFLASINKRNDFISKEIQKTLNQFKKNKNWHNEYLSEVPVSPYLLENLGYQENLFQKYFTHFIITVTAAAFVLWAFYSFNKSDLIRGSAQIYVMRRYKYISLEMVFFVILYSFFIQGLIYYENQLFLKTAIKSQLLDMGYKDIHFWNFVRIVTNNESGVFPFSSGGKIMVSASAYTVWLGGLLIIIIEYFSYQLAIKRRKGLVNITQKNHTIIAGWSESTPSFIKELLSARSSFDNQTIKIVCIAPNPESIIQNNSYIDSLVQKKSISFVDGYIRQKKTLEQSNAHLAKTIVLLTDDDTIQSDERTLLRALSISKFCKEKYQSVTSSQTGKQVEKSFETQKSINTVYVIAQVNSSEFIEDIQNAGVNGIVNRTNVIDGILIQSILNPGVSKLINNILSYSNDTNEFYTIDLLETKNSHLRNKTFDELLLPLRKQGILLIAIRVVYRDEKGNEIVDEPKILQKLECDGLYRQIITNPITKIEIKRKADEDQLLVLAVSSKKLKHGIENTEFAPS